MLTWFTARMEAAPADQLDWMEALANHVGFSPVWLRPPVVTRLALGCQSSVGSGTRTVGSRQPGFWCEVGEFMPGPELLLIAHWLNLVPSCGYTGIQSSNGIITSERAQRVLSYLREKSEYSRPGPARPGPTPSRSLKPYISGTACLIDKRSSLMNTTWM